MPAARRSLLACSFAVSLVAAFAAPASASVVVPRNDGAVHVEEERIAMSTTATRTVVWERLTLDVARGDVAWIVAVPKGGWIESADDNWLPALDGSTAPVIAPAASLACGDPLAPPHEETTETTGPIEPRAVDKAILAPTAPLLALDALRAKGWSIDAKTAAMLADLDGVGEQVEVLQLAAGSVGATRTLRVVGPAGRPFPSTLLPVLPPAPRIVVFTLAPMRTELDGLTAIEPAFETLTWQGSKSNYASLLSDALTSAGSGVVVPFASPDALFVDGSMAHLAADASVVRRYFRADDVSSTAQWACARRAIDAATHGGVVAPTCAVAPPWTTDAPLPPCDAPSPSSVPADAFECGGLDDLAVAVGGATPGATWITRWEATSSLQSSTPTPIADAHAGALPAYHEAQSAKSGACGDGSSGGPSPSPSPTGNPDGNGDPLGSSSDDSNSNSYATSSGTGGGCDATFGCASHSTTSGSSGCDSSDGSSNDGCSSSSDSGGGGGCSSSSSGSSDSGCGGGSGGGSSSDNGCGGSSGSSSGGGCGGGSSSADNGCSLSRKHTNLRATPFVYLGALLAVLARRATRRRRFPRGHFPQ